MREIGMCNIIFLDIYVVSPTMQHDVILLFLVLLNILITPNVLDAINLSLRLTPDDTLFTIGRVSPFPTSMICCELKSQLPEIRTTADVFFALHSPLYALRSIPTLYHGIVELERSANWGLVQMLMIFFIQSNK